LKQFEVVPVRLRDSVDRSYDITIKPDALANVSDVIGKLISSTQAVVITDDVVGKLYLERLVSQIEILVAHVDAIVLPSGEQTKSCSDCAQLWQKLCSLGVDRKTTVIALGGGVIGDLAGFVAATFARGLSLIQIPTTLLAQVDSSVGGKVGINLPQAKNMIGAFWQPCHVLIDPAVLRTLDTRNFNAGMAEVIKYGVIMDLQLFEFVESRIADISNREPAIMTELIAWCCRCKALIVERDEREVTGLRAILNYGHTLGHAIESVFGYGTFLHGEAVAIGMHFAARLACELGLLNHTEWRRQASLLSAFNLPCQLPADRTSELIAAMHRDKKVSAGVLNLILPTEIGLVTTVPSPNDKLLMAIIQELIQG
jgi:3-dehydroquinate synthase